MGPPGLSSPDERGSDGQWRSAGDRIQALLDAAASGGAVARERAELLVREITDLYGAGLERILSKAVARHPELTETFAADDLIASLLLVHGLHPHDVRRRVADALDTVRPYLGSHGGDVSLIDVVGDHNYTVRLQFTGSCKSCPSSAVTLEMAVEDAVRAAAPEVTEIEVVAAEKQPDAGLIPVESLLSRVHTSGHTWQPVPGLAELTPGEVGGFRVAGTTVLACRVGDHLFAYQDRCGNCRESLAGAHLHRAAIGPTVLRCPNCHAHFDVVHAGACLDGNGYTPNHLEPIPLLERNGLLSMALVTEESAL